MCKLCLHCGQVRSGTVSQCQPVTQLGWPSHQQTETITGSFQFNRAAGQAHKRVGVGCRVLRSLVDC